MPPDCLWPRKRCRVRRTVVFVGFILAEFGEFYFEDRIGGGQV